MTYELHPEAALEHEEQVAYYETCAIGLGSRYHAAFREAVFKAGEAPQRYRIVADPFFRRVSLQGFPCGGVLAQNACNRAGEYQ